MIRVLAPLVLLCLLLAWPAGADTRSVYTITDIRVDERAPNVIEAQQRALATARRIGAQRLIEKITLPSDRMAAGGGVYIDGATAERLIAAVDVQKETRGGGRYKGVLSVVGNPRTVRAWLEEREIPYIDSQAPRALVVPIGNGSDDLAWSAAWPGESNGSLAPYITAMTGNYGESAEYVDLRDEMLGLGAERGVLAKLSGSSGNYTVRLTLVTGSGRLPLGQTSRAPTLADAVSDAEALLSETWKKNSIIRTNTRTIIEASVLYTSIAEWNTLRGALARSPLVSDFQTEAVSRDGAMVQFAYAGDNQRLTRDLRQRGVALDADPAGWVLTSAISRVP